MGIPQLEDIGVDGLGWCKEQRVLKARGAGDDEVVGKGAKREGGG